MLVTLDYILSVLAVHRPFYTTLIGLIVRYWLYICVIIYITVCQERVTLRIVCRHHIDKEVGRRKGIYLVVDQ